jgi:hypothetical protein
MSWRDVVVVGEVGELLVLWGTLFRDCENACHQFMSIPLDEEQNNGGSET